MYTWYLSAGNVCQSTVVMMMRATAVLSWKPLIIWAGPASTVQALNFRV